MNIDWRTESSWTGKPILVGTDDVNGRDVCIKIMNQDALIHPDTAREMAKALNAAADKADGSAE